MTSILDAGCVEAKRNFGSFGVMTAPNIRHFDRIWKLYLHLKICHLKLNWLIWVQINEEIMLLEWVALSGSGMFSPNRKCKTDSIIIQKYLMTRGESEKPRVLDLPIISSDAMPPQLVRARPLFDGDLGNPERLQVLRTGVEPLPNSSKYQMRFEALARNSGQVITVLLYCWERNSQTFPSLGNLRHVSACLVF